MLSVSLLVTLLAVPLIAVIMVQSAVCANITLQMNQAPDNEKAVYVLRLLRAQSVGALVSVVGFTLCAWGLTGRFATTNAPFGRRAQPYATTFGKASKTDLCKVSAYRYCRR